MKKLAIVVIVLVALYSIYWFVTRPNGTKCDCQVQSYFEYYNDYCKELNKDELGPVSMDDIYSKRGSCISDFKNEIDEANGYTKYDAIVWYDNNGMPTLRPVVLKDDGKYPENKNADQIRKALETGKPTRINK